MGRRRRTERRRGERLKREGEKTFVFTIDDVQSGRIFFKKRRNYEEKKKGERNFEFETLTSIMESQVIILAPLYSRSSNDSGFFLP